MSEAITAGSEPRSSYKYQIILYYFITSLAVVVATGCAVFLIISNLLYNDVAEKSQNMASILSQDSELKQAISNRDTAGLRSLINQHYTHSDADFIVISDPDNIRLYHPDPLQVNIAIKDIGNINLLRNGKSYTVKNTGYSGASVKTRAPFILDGKYIGYVSVGYTEAHRQGLLASYFTPFLALLISVFILILLGGVFSYRLLKKQMSGLTPEMINYRYQVRRAILHAIYDGVIAVSPEGRIIAINNAAKKMLSIDHPHGPLTGHKITDYVVPADFFLSAERQECHDVDVAFNGSTFIANRAIILNQQDEFAGFVISLREKTNETLMTKQVNHIKHESEELRVISHEFKNRLAVIYGLIQLGEYERVSQYVAQENAQLQQFYDAIIKSFHCPCVAGLILGKLGRAGELGIDLRIDPLSYYTGANAPLSAEEMACIIGNLLDNALEATVKTPTHPQSIELYLNDGSDEIVLSVQDNGPGLDQIAAEALFAKGATSKPGRHHGVGLYLVQSLVQKARGECLVDTADDNGGAVFSVYIPKV
ncbi:sensor histidine kinase [Dickeya solani]|uniref:histidine kinase n=1 Tax=Dickeya solani D s0432-1 TaxID=1231725 RepID=A0AAV3K647_9GAMM|nr:sensor histidine kinase [Dickeya solani]ANE74319.1 histidine kinase [Dickeya solani IPO 2222]AUC41545.1 Sensor kinase CitA, DpiB [Dickeya solani RNS 08.23.3.1.A]AUH10266.1 histidine kinase [Dickeya solani D s0432-1]AUH14211.1 histidine kinase [Dickeya solani]AYQ48784.1 Sensor histidine kinase DpiB [Dickeya solani]